MVKSNYQENKELRKDRKQNKIKKEEEIIMAENKEMNAKLADEELDQAAGGASKPKKKFKAGDMVYRKGYEHLGDNGRDPAQVVTSSYRNNMWQYEITFFPSRICDGYAGRQLTSRQRQINQQYGTFVPEKELYKA